MSESTDGSNMHPIFAVTSEDIEKLNDVDFRELVARLAKSDLTRLGISSSCLTWGGDQRAADGGIDVSISSCVPILTDGYILSSETGYQVKAENFPRQKIISEMAPNGILRSSIRKLADLSGAYVIASSKGSLSKTALENRKNAMLDVLKDYGLEGKLKVDFYDRRRLADWAENHPALIAWLRSKIGRPIQGWKPYGPWAYREENTDSEYLLDERQKIIVPTKPEGIVVMSALNQMRGELADKEGCVRLVGLSGVGKTRFV